METTRIESGPKGKENGKAGASHERTTFTGRQAAPVNSRALAAALTQTVSGEVRFDPGSRALYATDASNYRQVPLGVVIPRNADDVVNAVDIARRFGAPVLPRGGGTSLAGQCCNVALVLDMSKYFNRVLAIDPERQQAHVQPGAVLDDLRSTAERVGLTYGPDPATHNHCTLGGMIGNNSCGVHSILAGKTDANVDELDVLTYDGLRLRVGATGEDELQAIIRNGGRRGEIYRRLAALRDRYADAIRRGFPHIPRLVSGYALDHLLPENGFHVARALVGTEGTCVTVLEATVRLVTSPASRVLVLLGYPDVYSACDHVPEILTHHPIGLEGFDERMVEAMQRQNLYPGDLELLPAGRGWLLVEFGGSEPDAVRDQAQGLADALGSTGQHWPQVRLYDDRERQGRVWRVREAALGATAQVPGQPLAWPGWEDSAVAPDRLGSYLRDLRHLLDSYAYNASFYGHFGQGCVHMRIDFDLETGPGIERFRRYLDDAADLVVGYGGSLSGEHGDGQARASLLPKMFGDELMQAFREFKAIWDPEGKMNPGKVVDADRPDQNLRLGVTYDPWRPKTQFAFPDDNHSFARATLRCVGVGQCRREGGGTMCPSYMVTREEKHSTRGRARLLFEMLQGEVIGRQGWHDEAVKDALDLCLACKGCRGDCPVHVDMATYKAEFLAHYYAGRVRPRSAYAFGLIFRWARLAARVPDLVNLTTQMPGLRTLARLAAGIAPQRRIPRFAAQTFQAWFASRPARPHGQAGDVLLWADTFNNYFHPDTARAAVEVLETAGYHVRVAEQTLCCGRPLYDYGMLDQAKRQLRQILDTLRPEIRAGMPVVVLEPSCAAVFRDELTNLLADDDDAHRLQSQTFTLAEFLEDRDYRPPHLPRRALLHGHCHQKAIMRMDAEETLLRKMELDCQVPDSGCCGMAGAFGFEAGDHYEVSVKAGERALLPAVRKAPADMLIIADGFSCREQIRQGSNRRGLHLAQVLQLALHEGDRIMCVEYPEDRYAVEPRWNPLRGLAQLLAPLAAGALIRWALYQRWHRRQ